jgi:hypothetical protein
MLESDFESLCKDFGGEWDRRPSDFLLHAAPRIIAFTSKVAPTLANDI